MPRFDSLSEIVNRQLKRLQETYDGTVDVKKQASNYRSRVKRKEATVGATGNRSKRGSPTDSLPYEHEPPHIFLLNETEPCNSKDISCSPQNAETEMCVMDEMQGHTDNQEEKRTSTAYGTSNTDSLASLLVSWGGSSPVDGNHQTSNPPVPHLEADCDKPCSPLSLCCHSVKATDPNTDTPNSNANVKNLPGRGECLDLSHRELSEIPFSYFRSFPQLRTLDLSFNYLIDVSIWLPSSLEVLNLAGNRFSRVPHLPSLPKLRHLDLSFNPLEQEVSIAAFVSLFPSLEQLWLKSSPTAEQETPRGSTTSLLVDGKPYSPTKSHSDLHTSCSSDSHNQSFGTDNGPSGLRLPKPPQYIGSSMTSVACAGNSILYATDPAPSTDVPKSISYRNPVSSRRNSPHQLTNKNGAPPSPSRVLATSCKSSAVEHLVHTKKSLEETVAQKDAILQSSLGTTASLVERCNHLERTLQESRGELARIHEYWKASQQEAERHSSQVLAWQRLAAENAASAASLQKELTALREESSKVQEHYTQELLRMRGASEDALNDLKKELAATREQLVEKESQFAAERVAQRQSLAALEDTLKKELVTAQETVRTTNENIWNVKAAQKTLEVECEALRRENQVQSAEVDRLRALCAAHATREDAIRSDLLQERERAESAQRELDTCQVTLRDLQRQLDERCVQWIPRHEFTQQAAQLDELRTEMVAQKDHIARVTERNAVMRLEMEQLHIALTAAEKRVATSSLDLEMKAQQLDEAHRQLEILKGTLAARTKELDQHKKNGTDKATLETLNRRIEEETAGRQRAEEALQKVKETSQREKEETLGYFQREIERLEQDLYAQQTRFQAESTKRDKHQADREAHEVGDLRKQLETAAQNLQNATEENSSLKTSLVHAEQLLKQRDDELRVLLMEMETIQAAHEAKLQRVEDFFKAMAAT